MEAETFGQRLMRLRLAAGLSQRKLARESDLTNGTISQAEADKLWVDQLPSYDIVRRLAKALGVATAVLAGDDDGPVSVRSENEQVMDRLLVEFAAQLTPESVDTLREMSEVEPPEVFREHLRTIGAAMAANVHATTKIARMLRRYRGEG